MVQKVKTKISIHIAQTQCQIAVPQPNWVCGTAFFSMDTSISP